MSRITQAYAYLNVKPSDLTNDWIKNNLTDITITESLLELRKQYLKNFRSEAKSIEKNINFEPLRPVS
jgi:hypothetical protein